MNVLRQIGDLSSLGAPAHLAIGVFDGIHKGHQAVIRAAVDSAAVNGGLPVVVTFDPHPIAVLRPDSAPRLLTYAAHQQQILAGIGIKHVLVIEFDQAFAARPAEEFVEALASACEPLQQISVGAEWNFGRGRKGNVALLKEMGSRLGFTVEGVDPIRSADGEVISSTLVRRAVREGDLARAEELLGRAYTVLGDVVKGRQLGRTIGFPTANLAVHSEQLPPSGVYAVRVNLGGELLGGVANLGKRPTVEEADVSRLLEVHLFDLDRDLYGKSLEVYFEKFLRSEKKFDGVEELKKQILIDASAARSIVESSKG